MTSLRSLAIAACALLAVACAPQRSQPVGSAAFAVEVASGGAAITSVTVEGQPANVTATLAYDATSGKFKGTLEVPAGAQTFTVRAYAGATLVATGSASATVVAGETIYVQLTLLDTIAPPPPPPNQPYVTTFVVPASVGAGAVATFTATAVDPQGGALALEWSQFCSAEGGTFGTPSAATTTWTAPGAATSCEITFKATSTSGLFATKTATVTVAGTGTGSVDVVVDYVAQPVIDHVWLEKRAATPQATCSVLRTDATGTCPDSVPAGSVWTVAFTFGTTGAHVATASLTDDCGGSASPDSGVTLPAGTGGAAFQWTSPATAAVCILKAKVTVEGLVDTFPIELVVLAATPASGYSIAGTARTFTGAPLPGATVRLWQDTGTTLELWDVTTVAITSPDGSYVFHDVPPGRYAVTPELAGVAWTTETQWLPATVTSADVLGLDFASIDTREWTAGPAPGTLWGPSRQDLSLPLHALWGTAPEDAWAVGQRSLILHWDGTVWAGVPNPAYDPIFHSDANSLRAIWGSGPNDVWTVGGQTVLHWNGTEWTSVAPPPAPPNTTGDDFYDDIWLYAVWGNSANDVWTAGLNGAIGHWDGTGWQTVTDPLIDNSYDGIWGSGPNDVWFVGGAGAVLHWDGSYWSSVESGTRSHLRSVWGSGPNDVWASGDFDSNGSALIHWDGSRWSNVATPLSDWSKVSLIAGWGTSANDVWLVGQKACKTLPGNPPIILECGRNILHWDGSVWSVPSNPWSTNPYSVDTSAIWTGGDGVYWVVGTLGILRYGP